MPFYKYPAVNLVEHGCRIVKDEGYVPCDAESSIDLSPIVDIPESHLLVGSKRNRLMLVHSLLMNGDDAFVPRPEAGRDLCDDDVLDLANGLMENFGYESLVRFAKVGACRIPQTAEQKEVVYRIRAGQGHVWATVASCVLSDMPDFRDQAEQGLVLLARPYEPGSKTFGQPRPLLRWESHLMSEAGSPRANGWKFPSATLLRMIDTCLAHPEISALVDGQVSAPARERA